MTASVQYRQQERSLGMVLKEKDDDLAMFLAMRNCEKERSNLNLLQNSFEFDDPLGSKLDSSSVSKISSTMPGPKPHADDFLNLEMDKTDYDWLLTPPGTPLFPSLELESQKTVTSQIGISNAHPTVLKSRPANPPVETTSMSNVTSRRPASSTGENSSISGIRRPSPSGRAASTATRQATPTAQPTLTTTAKSSRPSPPASRATLPSTEPIALPMRSSTPTRSIARSSTPTARPSMQTASKSTSRSATPTCRPSARAGRSSSVTKSGATTLKKPVPSRGTSPTVKSISRKPSEMPGFSHDTTPNLRTSLPERPASASRGRPSAPTAQPSSIKTSSNGRLRQQSSSPSRGRAPNGKAYNGRSSVLKKSRGYSDNNDDVSPVLIGTKMVERVVNMRKLAPPKQDDHLSIHNNPSGKSSYHDNSGFGRTLSKNSLDMALRHMDIRRSIPGNLCPLMTNIPASSVYSVRSGSTKSRTGSVSDSPLATSSTASSERSFNNNTRYLDGSEVEDNDHSSEKGHSSPASQTNW